MAYFPFFMEITGKNGLVVGGGKVAFHKLQKLLPYGAKLKVIAPVVLEELEQLALKNDICVIKRAFTPDDLSDMHFVIAASDKIDVNAAIAKLCNEHRILVNVVDNKDASSFIFPSLVKAKKLCIGISTEGASPEVAALIRGQIAALIPADMDKILDYLDSLRPLAKRYIQDSDQRAAFLKDMARTCIARDGVFDECETMLQLKRYIQNNEYSSTNIVGKVLLVGAGCGGYDLITLKGLRAIQQAKVLVYDDLIDQRLLEYASERCEQIYVGKRSGRHSMAQEQINTLLIQKAKQGGLVVRLKGGDPFVFGRGMEEVTALRAEGIDVDYVPGITSCIAVPAFAGIPVTHRNISRSFHVIAGHTAADSQNKDLAEEIDFQTLARLEGTLVFLMGIGHLAQIAKELIQAGKQPSTPAAVVHKAFDKAVYAVQGTLLDIAEKVTEAGILTPAVIVVGDVVDIGSEKF